MWYSWLKMVAASEPHIYTRPPWAVHRIPKPRGAATTPGLFFSSPTTEQTAKQPGGNRARSGQPMQRVGPGDGLPIEGTGVVPRQITSPVDAVGPDAGPGICHRSNPGRRRVIFGGLATDALAPFAKGSPRWGEPCSSGFTIRQTDAPHLIVGVSQN